MILSVLSLAWCAQDWCFKTPIQLVNQLWSLNLFKLTADMAANKHVSAFLSTLRLTHSLGILKAELLQGTLRQPYREPSSRCSAPKCLEQPEHGRFDRSEVRLYACEWHFPSQRNNLRNQEQGLLQQWGWSISPPKHASANTSGLSLRLQYFSSSLVVWKTAWALLNVWSRCQVQNHAQSIVIAQICFALNALFQYMLLLVSNLNFENFFASPFMLICSCLGTGGGKKKLGKGVSWGKGRKSAIAISHCAACQPTSNLLPKRQTSSMHAIMLRLSWARCAQQIHRPL